MAEGYSVGRNTILEQVSAWFRRVGVRVTVCATAVSAVLGVTLDGTGASPHGWHSRGTSECYPALNHATKSPLHPVLRPLESPAQQRERIAHRQVQECRHQAEFEDEGGVVGRKTPIPRGQLGHGDH